MTPDPRDLTIRPARPEEFAQLAVIAREGDSAADAGYLDFVSEHGTLLVAARDEVVAAFGGVIEFGGSAMVTDLFVDADARGSGIGGRLLETLLDGRPQRMTFSSQHAAALPAYRRAGMTPSWRLLYFAGTTPSPASKPAALPRGAAWRHDRPELIRYFASRGATIDADVVTMHGPDSAVDIVRLHSDTPVATFTAVLDALPPGSSVTCCTPEHSPVAAAARRLGFDIIDHDIFCASTDVALPDDLHCLHPGLG